MRNLLACLIFFSSLPNSNLQAQCNGDSSLCDKRYDQVVYVTTHNAFNYGPTFQAPNQSFPVSQQLSDGVRAFMLDVYDWLGTPTLYHGIIALGSEPLEDVLIDIQQFLQANPTEVVTIIFEANISASAMATVFTSSGLDPYLHTQTFGQPWPTLQEMIDVDQRLVVLSDVDDAGPSEPWYHYMWDYCVETHYSNSSRADFSCEFNRGDSVNSLFILNHFITNQLAGTGELDSSIVANANPYFLDRANLCKAEKAHLPNFLTVDFYDVGNVFDTKDSLNANFIPVGIEEPLVKRFRFNVFPNPTSGNIQLSMDMVDKDDITVQIRDVTGRILLNTSLSSKKDIVEISASQMGKGIFFIELKSASELLGVEKVILQ